MLACVIKFVVGGVTESFLMNTNSFKEYSLLREQEFSNSICIKQKCPRISARHFTDLSLGVVLIRCCYQALRMLTDIQSNPLFFFSHTHLCDKTGDLINNQRPEECIRANNNEG